MMRATPPPIMVPEKTQTPASIRPERDRAGGSAARTAPTVDAGTAAGFDPAKEAHRDHRCHLPDEQRAGDGRESAMYCVAKLLVC